MGTTLSAKTTVLKNSLTHYYDEVGQALSILEPSRGAGGGFSPAFRLPERSPALEEFFEASEIAVTALPEYRGHRLRLLDLMRNPATRTTKTIASLTIVARAVCHIAETGERIMIITPSSANKATALRDAVHRAIATGLVTADQLQITSLVPGASTGKLWSSPLSEDVQLRHRNPLVVHECTEPASVKDLATAFATGHADHMYKQHGVRAWYTLDLDNYRPADAIRAFAERDLLPGEAATRTHVHSVSSAFGLLGHHLGHQITAQGEGGSPPQARYFLVQHLGTPDMVLSLRYGSHDRANLPAYRLDQVDALYRQDQDPCFPATTYDPDEHLDATFYTRRPATSAQMDSIITAQGGGGIVVSLHECLARYGEVRLLLSDADVRLPADPRKLREWSLVMAVTGTLNAADRGLLPDSGDVLIHGSGSYSDADYRPLPAGHRVSAADAEELAVHVEGAMQAASGR
jgi:hypothetical protein